MIEEMRRDVERCENWRELRPKMPSIKFPHSWNVTIVPPYAGAVCRFEVRVDELPDVIISVYLDVFKRLAIVDDYWEVYPITKISNDDELLENYPQRCSMNDTKRLVEIINDLIVEARDFLRRREESENLKCCQNNVQKKESYIKIRKYPDEKPTGKFYLFYDHSTHEANCEPVDPKVYWPQVYEGKTWFTDGCYLGPLEEIFYETDIWCDAKGPLAFPD